MTPEDLIRLAARLTDFANVCKLPEAICIQIGVESPMVRLAADDLAHILKGHRDVDVSQLCMLPKAVQFGLLILDEKDPGHLISAYQDPYVESRRYKTVLRIRAKQLWVLTFHRTAKKHTISLLKRGPVLKTHDRQ
jgi:hypothetical protein